MDTCGGLGERRYSEIERAHGSGRGVKQAIAAESFTIRARAGRSRAVSPKPLCRKQRPYSGGGRGAEGVYEAIAKHFKFRCRR